jgi:hypothetical protein
MLPTPTLSLDEIRPVIDPVSLLDTGADGQPTGEWTRAIKTGLCGLAPRFNCHACAGQCKEADWREEWLYDLLWLRVHATEDRTTVLDSPLVAEIEWGRHRYNGPIRHDFQKLLLARANLRLMVFQAPDSERGREIVGELVEQVGAYSGSRQGDRYLFAYYGTRTRRFEYRDYVHR